MNVDGLRLGPAEVCGTLHRLGMGARRNVAIVWRMASRRGKTRWPVAQEAARLIEELSLKRQLLLVTVGLLAAGCQKDNLGEVDPAIHVCLTGESVCETPLVLGAFSTKRGPHQVSVDIYNSGTGNLSIGSIEVVEGEGLLIGPSPPTAVGAVARAPLPLVLAPKAGTNVVKLAIESNDPETPHFEFEVHFEGVEPDLVLCPLTPPLDGACSDNLTVDLGEVRPTQAVDVTVMVRNAGTELLDISGATLSDSSSVAGEYAILTSTAAGSLEPGAESPMVVRYAPQDGFSDTVAVTVQPAYNLTDPAVLTLIANAPPNDAPVAMAYEVDTQSTDIAGEVGLGIWLDGRASSDPEGDPLAFGWSVVAAPAGSQAAPDTPDAKLTRFAPDVLGPYTLQLQVTDSLGLVGFADVNVTAEPRHQLRVTANWGTNVGDVDLHMVPEGQAVFSIADCFFANPNADWGVASLPRDDGVLLADSEAGNGSERIAIARPAAGRYDIYINYFDSRGGLTANVDVSITGADGTINFGGTSGSVSTTCETWKVGTVEWPGGTFTPSTDAHTSNCYTGGP